MSALHTSRLAHLELTHRGKVRDIYRVDDDHMLIVASDRLSAFDVVLPQPIPGKGEVLTRVADFWFARTQGIVPNHLSGIPVSEVVTDPTELASLGERATVVRRLKALPVEAIVRGYLIGSGWKDYQKNGAVCGIALPAGLRQADRLPEAIYTPSTKAAVGDHDENVDFDHTVGLLGRDLAEQVREASLRDLHRVRRLCPDPRHHHRRHQVRVRPGRRRASAPHRRGPDPGLLPLLARRPVPARHQPAELRQAVRARLPGDPGLGQDPARARAAPGDHRQDGGEIPRGGAAPDRGGLRPPDGAPAGPPCPQCPEDSLSPRMPTTMSPTKKKRARLAAS